MLGWALKKSFQGATGLRDAPQSRGDDTTQFDPPDTPAPVFAARAIKNAIWGQSVTVTEDHSSTKAKSSETQRVKHAANAKTTTNTTAPTNTTEKSVPTDTRSPNKLNSILLTPGTGTSRRKRVSFGRDVKAGNNIDPSPFTASATRDGKLRKKTTLQKALENARSEERKAAEPRVVDPEEDNTEEDWEWDDEDVCCQQDVTVDLNDPHSESGKYWKAEWARYREEARSDIEQLVKYKANARSFAVKKDTEAGQLSQKLKEEQAKVAELEKKNAEMTTKLAAARKHGTNEDNMALARDLAKQTSLVAEYREQIKALEAGIKEPSGEPNRDLSTRHRIDTSPRMEQSIIDVSRELRKARSELRQLDRLRDEVRRLKSNLAISRERVAELEAQASAGADSESSRVTKLEKQLREIKEESRQKDTEIRKLKREYDSLKRDAKSRTAEAVEVLQDKNTKIEQLEKEIKDLKATNTSKRPRDLDAAIAEHRRITQDLKSGIESLGRPSKYERGRPTNGRARAASIQDITLDMTQRSLLQDKDKHAPDGIRQGKGSGGGIVTDWTVDIPTLELQAQEKNRREGSQKPNREPISERNQDLSRGQAARSTRQRPLHDSDRNQSDALSNRVNESSDVKSREHRQPTVSDAPQTDRNQDSNSRRVANTQTTSLAEDKPTTRDTVDRTTRRSRVQARTSHTAPSSSEAPVIDLIEDQFSRLGDRDASGNTAARRTLPADRQAAALARLEQKRMKRRKESGQGLDKENVRP
ncbi:hypothetical protein GGS21DRAFT_496291 [Xylaria nigripes]|nr:hypothetical protein GGS21DRAFT_496291 [Xylaria nigripes]